MKKLKSHLILSYLRAFIAIFLALLFFYVGVDYMQNYKRLPDSANLHILYMVYNGFQAISFLLPLSISFAFVSFVLKLVKTNELTIFYALGYTKKQIIKPIFFTSLTLLSIYMALNTTQMAYAKEKYIKILKGSYFSNYRDNLFLKYQDSYIYIGKLIPSQNKALNIRIFQINNHKLIRYIQAQEGYFESNEWMITNAKIITKPQNIDLGQKGVSIEYLPNIKILQGFKPRILDSVYDDNSITFSLSIKDAITTWILLNNENINNAKVRLIFYNMTFSPLFAVFIIVIVFYYTPSSNRIFNPILFSSIVIFATLMVWGFLFLLSKISFGAVIIPEVAILLPIGFLGIIAMYYYIKLDSEYNL